MKISCDIIKDLLPLYHDGVCSAVTREAVAEHMEGCAACRAEYEKLCGSDPVEAAYDEERETRIAASFRYLRRKSRLKLIAAIAASLIAAGLIALAVYTAVDCASTLPLPKINAESVEGLKAEMERSGLYLLYPDPELFGDHAGVDCTAYLNGRKRSSKALSYRMGGTSDDGLLIWSVDADPSKSKVSVRNDAEYRGTNVQRDLHVSSFASDDGSRTNALLTYSFSSGGAHYTVRGWFWGGTEDGPERDAAVNKADGILWSVTTRMLDSAGG